MTYEERIQILDNGIIRMNTYLSYGSSYNSRLYGYGEDVKKYSIDILEKIGAPQYSINSVQYVSFDACRRDMLGGHMAGEYEMLCANKCNAYKQSVNSIISILNQERTRLSKEQADEEQQKIYDAQIASNKLQKESILWAKIAAWAGIGSAIIGLASIVFSIFLYLCKH